MGLCQLPKPCISKFGFFPTQNIKVSYFYFLCSLCPIFRKTGMHANKAMTNIFGLNTYPCKAPRFMIETDVHARWEG